jgi:uncharacterized protein (TIGR02266 family)
MKNKSNRLPRVDLRVSVQVEQPSRLQTYYSRNLSSGGIYIELNEPPPPLGTKLKLTFEVPGLGKPIQAEAEVLHHHVYETMSEQMQKVKGYGMGLKFSDLSSKDEKLISQYVAGKGLHVRS